MTIEEIKEKSPVLVNKYVWEELMEKSQDGTIGGEKISFHAIKLEYAKLTESEKSLLSDEAKECCYLIEGENKYEFLGYYCFVGDISDIPEYWKDRISIKGDDIYEIDVPTKVFDEDYFCVTTKRVKKMDILYKFSLEWLQTREVFIGVPFVMTAESFVRKQFSSEKTKSTINILIEHCESPATFPINCTSLFRYPSLQEIVLQGCDYHDLKDGTYKTYTYTIGNQKFTAVTTIQDGECNVRFTSEELVPEDKENQYYLFFNNWMYKHIDKMLIFDKSEYYLKKLREDIIK